MLNIKFADFFFSLPFRLLIQNYPSLAQMELKAPMMVLPSRDKITVHGICFRLDSQVLNFVIFIPHIWFW